MWRRLFLTSAIYSAFFILHRAFILEIRAQRKALTHRARRVRNAEAFLNSVGENPRFCKRWVKQYPVSLSGAFQSLTLMNAQIHHVPQEHCCACIGTQGFAVIRVKCAGSCEALCEVELCERFKQSAQALELLHERKMWNEQKPCCLSAASLRFLRMFFHILSEC